MRRWPKMGFHPQRAYADVDFPGNHTWPSAEHRVQRATGGGSYGSALLIQSYYFPRKYVALVATGGLNRQDNPIGFREHVNPAYQGLQHIPRHWQGYPLQDSFFAGGFGVGTRRIGARLRSCRSRPTRHTPHRQRLKRNGSRLCTGAIQGTAVRLRALRAASALAPPLALA